MRKAGHGWPAAASQAWMPAEPRSILRPGRRRFRSQRHQLLLYMRCDACTEAKRHMSTDIELSRIRLILCAFVKQPFPSTRRIDPRSEEHTSELQSLMRISYHVFCLQQK